MKNLGKTIEHYCQELFDDLGLTILSEDEKADLFAKVQERIHGIVLDVVRPKISKTRLNDLHSAMDQENYDGIEKVFEQFPVPVKNLEKRMQQEVRRLKVTILSEMEHG